MSTTPETYSYEVSSTLNGAVDLTALTKQITDSTEISRKVSSISTVGTAVEISFLDALTPDEEVALQALVAAHDGQPLPVEPQKVTLQDISKMGGRIQVETFSPTADSNNAISHDFTDRCTWYSTSVYVEDEVPVRVEATRAGDGKDGHIHYKLAHDYIIDVTHGRITREDQLIDANGINYDVTVKVNGVEQEMQNPDIGRTDQWGDYFVNYERGEIWWVKAPPSPTDLVEVSYHYPTSSHWILQPEPGEMIKIKSVEAQFATDLIMNDTFCFQLWAMRAMVPYIHAALKPWERTVDDNPGGNPYEFIPAKVPEKFKTMKDFINDSNGTYPVIPSIGGNSWRGNAFPVVTFPWNYQSSLDVYPGMQVRVFTENDREQGGSYGAVTVYTLMLPAEP